MPSFDGRNKICYFINSPEMSSFPVPMRDINYRFVRIKDRQQKNEILKKLRTFFSSISGSNNFKEKSVIKRKKYRKQFKIYKSLPTETKSYLWPFNIKPTINLPTTCIIIDSWKVETYFTPFPWGLCSKRLL